MKLSYYRNKADKAFQQSLTSLKKTCEMCGKPAVCQHHFFPKSSSSALRYDEQNAISVCTGCHLGFHSARAAAYHGMCIDLKGMEWFKDLMRRKNDFVKPNVQYYKDVIEFYDH